MTFRGYGIACILIVIAYGGIDYFYLRKQESTEGVQVNLIMHTLSSLIQFSSTWSCGQHLQVDGKYSCLFKPPVHFFLVYITFY